MSEYPVEVKNVTKRFRMDKQKGIFRFRNIPSSSKKKYLTALDDVSFYAKKGEVLGIIGLNGSGKTTLLQVISGLYRPDSGRVIINGSLAPILRIGTGFNQELIPSENIILYGMLLGFSKNEIKEKVESIIEFAELERFSGMKLKHFSSGMRARLAFSTMLQLNPDILLIDEVLAVGDIKFKQKSSKAFRSFIEKGKTILITSHQTSTISDLCNRVMLLQNGKVLMIGDTKEVIQKYNDMNQSHNKNTNN